MHEFDILLDKTRPVHLVSFPTEFNHYVPLPNWNEERETDLRSGDGLMSGKKASSDDTVEDRSAEAHADKDYADSLKVILVVPDQQTVTIREYLIDIGLPESGLLGDVSALCGYLCDELGQE